MQVVPITVAWINLQLPQNQDHKNTNINNVNGAHSNKAAVGSDSLPQSNAEKLVSELFHLLTTPYQPGQNVNIIRLAFVL